MRRGLVLSGGGATAAFHVGAVRELVSRGYQWDCFYGTSAGAILCAWLAQHTRLDDMRMLLLSDMWASLKTKDLLKPRFPRYISALWNDSVFSEVPLRSIIANNISDEAIRSAGKDLAVNSVCLETGTTEVFRKNSPNLLEAIVASGSIPGAFPPVEIAGKHYVDGSVRTNTLVKLAAEECDKVDVIVTDSGRGSTWEYEGATTLEVLLRSGMLVLDEAHDDDFWLGMDTGTNALVNVIRPTSAIGSLLDFSEESARKAMEAGRRAASVK